MAPVTTICIVGFAPDAPPRELKNLCRFMSGFEGAHVAFAGASGQATALFVKFNTSGAAAVAIDTITGQPFDTDAPSAAQTLKAEFARREMEVRQSPAPVVHGGAPPPTKPNGGGYGPASAPALATYGGGGGGGGGHAPGGGLMTIVVLYLREKGIYYEDVRQWFIARPGYVSQQFNERIDGIFVRFDSPQRAERALQDANAAGYGAEWARRNLDDDRGPPPAQPAMLHPSQPAYAAGGAGAGGGAAYGGGSAPGKRLLGHTGGELVTICILGIAEKGLSHEELQGWLSERSGFVSMQMNDRIGGIFAKFASQAAAERAMNDANANQFGAEWARRNLDDDRPPPGQGPAAAAAAAAPAYGGGYGPAPGHGGAAKRLRASGGEIDTAAVLGVREKEQLHGQGALQEWFQHRPGFVTLQINDRIDALFVKFSSPAAAEQAIQDANSVGFSAEWARRNLDL